MERRSFSRIGGALCGLLWVFLVIPGPLFADGFPKPGKDDRCPVCGMFVHKYPKWAAGFVFQSGARYFHCSPKCMLHNLHNVSKYQPGETREKISQIWITEYYTTMPADAKEVFFVVGTSLVGPMGLDLIPVRGKGAAENFKKDYDGELILSLDQISPDEILKARTGRLRPKKSF